MLALELYGAHVNVSYHLLDFIRRNFQLATCSSMVHNIQFFSTE